MMNHLRACFGVLLLATAIITVATIGRSSVDLAAQTPNLGAAITCNASAPISGNTIATAQLVALTAGQRIYVCAVAVNGAGITTAKLVRGTGTNCGTGTADLMGAAKLIDGATFAVGDGVGSLMRLPAGEALCWTNSAAIQVSGFVSYTKF